MMEFADRIALICLWFDEELALVLLTCCCDIVRACNWYSVVLLL